MGQLLLIPFAAAWLYANCVCKHSYTKNPRYGLDWSHHPWNPDFTKNCLFEDLLDTYDRSDNWINIGEQSEQNVCQDITQTLQSRGFTWEEWFSWALKQ